MNIAVVQIGNSDDKLSQAQWAEYIAVMDEVVRRFGTQVHFKGFSEPGASWQNACWVFERNGRSRHSLTQRLGKIAGLFGQDSIAVTLGDTMLVEPPSYAVKAHADHAERVASTRESTGPTR